jgi:dolichol-phosphate mannosyltransferase
VALGGSGIADYPTPPLTGPAWLILPTYDEALNVEAIVRKSHSVLREAAGDEGFRILVVDDSSPDGTGEIADRLAAELAQVSVLHRAERAGLGPAYLAGFAHALEAGAGYVFEMDADFSHDPADLARLLAAVRDGGADLALGSRYVPGGGVSDWGPVRRLVSRGGSLYAAGVLRLAQRDLTGGFKCFRAEVLRAIDLPSVRSKGYAFQVELTYRAVRAGFRVVEVPIVFRDRRAGKSKMGARIVGEAALLVPRLPRHYTLYSESGTPKGARMAVTVNEVTDNNFQSEVLEADTPVLVDFWAPWCGPCRVVAPVLEEIANERSEQLKVVKLNVDDNQQTAAQYGVLSIPTMILFKHGQPAHQIVGAYPKKKIEAEIEPALAA